MSMYEKLMYLKRRSNLTTEEIALRSGIPAATLNKLFAGQTRQPKLHTLGRLCVFFHVSLQYLTDDRLPVSNCVAACTEDSRQLFLSERERDLFYQFRRLDEHSRQILELFLRMLAVHCPLSLESKEEKKLICFSPPAMSRGKVGTFADSASFRALAAPLTPVVREADYVVTVPDRSLAPAYLPGMLLGVRQAEPEDEQLGVFLVNGEGFIRKLQQRRGIRRLVAVNVDVRTFTVPPDAQFACLGTVLGAVRTYRWLRSGD